MKKILQPEFTKELMGFNQKQVMDYISSLEAELEIADVQLKKMKKELDTLRAENERLSSQQVGMRSDMDYLQDENHDLLKANQDLEDQLLHLKEKKLSNQDSQKNGAGKASSPSLSESDAEVKAIQDAIISAQRMGNIILAEASEKAAELKAEAEEAYQNAMESIEQQIQEMQQHADAIMADAQKKCDDLRNEYDHILLDVNDLKQDMSALYRKHLQMLQLLPENGTAQENDLEPEHMMEGNEQ